LPAFLLLSILNKWVDR